MSTPRSSPPLRVPTLTEVVEFETAPMAPAAPEPSDDGDLHSRILAQVRRQLDSSFESRLREAIAPALARCADSLIRDLQGELVTTLQGLVERAVEQERTRSQGAAAPAPRRDSGATPD